MEYGQMLSDKGKFLDMEGVTGSIPVPPTTETQQTNNRAPLWVRSGPVPPETSNGVQRPQRFEYHAGGRFGRLDRPKRHSEEFCEPAMGRRGLCAYAGAGVALRGERLTRHNSIRRSLIEDKRQI
jgi:hypothetical protein